MTAARHFLGPRASRPQYFRGGRDARGPGFAAFKTIVRFTLRLPARTLLALIRIYQRTLSPVLPVITFGRCGCRFTPSCSHYAVDAIRTHGAIAGVVLAAIRIVKCTPLHPGGFDPVPPSGRKPRCERIAT